jgi:nicotinate-nucleotide pyrophosphorylase (carboxylating)
MLLDPSELASAQRLIAWALEEDLGIAGDVTSQATIPFDLQGRADFVARAEGVLAGLDVAKEVFHAVDASVHFDYWLSDGARLTRGVRLATVQGRMRSILMAERTALNFLQHLSGVASLTRRFVERVAGTKAQILDTRKTLPGWRRLEKYAVRCGGGSNHRLGLCDGVLIKDNHLAALAGARDPIRLAIERARRDAPQRLVEVEVDSLSQLEAALVCRPDMILLDNMDVAAVREAVRRRDVQGPGILLEASGGVHFDTIRAIAETGVDRISIGALTHSAPALDIALDYAS